MLGLRGQSWPRPSHTHHQTHTYAGGRFSTLSSESASRGPMSCACVMTHHRLVREAGLLERLEHLFHECLVEGGGQVGEGGAGVEQRQGGGAGRVLCARKGPHTSHHRSPDGGLCFHERAHRCWAVVRPWSVLRSVSGGAKRKDTCALTGGQGCSEGAERRTFRLEQPV